MKKFLAFCALAVLAAGPALAENTYEHMNDLFQAKKFKKLESACRERLRAKPKSLDAYYFLAMENMAQGRPDDAVPAMLAFEKYHDEAEAILQKKQGKSYKLADPYYMNLYFLLGEYYVRKGDYVRSLAWLVRAKAKFDHDYLFQFFRGRCYAGLKDYGNAAKAFRRESELNPKEPSAFYNVATCYAKQGKAEAAVEWLRKAIKLQPQYRQDVQRDPNFKGLEGSRAFRKLIGK